VWGVQSQPWPGCSGLPASADDAAAVCAHATATSTAARCHHVEVGMFMMIAVPIGEMTSVWEEIKKHQA
jgi:hypothetical protein